MTNTPLRDPTDDAPALMSMGRVTPPLGPSDSSDSGSDVIGQDISAGDGDVAEPVDVATGPDSRRPGSEIEFGAGDDTDAAGTGERRSAANDAGAPEASDVAPDRIVDDPDAEPAVDAVGGGDALDDIAVDSSDADDAEAIDHAIADATSDAAEDATDDATDDSPDADADDDGVSGDTSDHATDDIADDASAPR